MNKNLLLLCSALLGASSAQTFARDAQGGGFTDRGITGQWFSNADFNGEPAFERRDVRIDFDWGTSRAPGGAICNGFDAIGTDNYSVKWTGSLIPRYSEEYTFFLTVDDGALLKIRPKGGTWTTLINKLTESGEHTATFHMESGKTYDIAIGYVEKTGEANASLEWSGESFPREVIDPLFQMCINIETYERSIWAEGIAGGRGRWEKSYKDGGGELEIDERGNPTGDGEFIFFEILSPYILNPKYEGTMRLTFTGKADITASGNCSLIAGSVSYDAEANRTTALIQGESLGANVAKFMLKNTSRTGQPGGPAGVTNVKLNLPSEVGSATPFAEGMVFHPIIINAFNRLTGLRFQRTNDQSVNWDERTPPYWPYQKAGRMKDYVYNDRYANGDWHLKSRSRTSHEYEIMFCNITGNDYYISTPHLATMEYYNNLALLIKNGSNEDGIPYPEAVADPFYPPLNPNLRVFVELSNELWNFAQIASYAPYSDLQHEVRDMLAAGSPDFDLLNYDGLLEKEGKNDKGEWKAIFALSRRWWVLRTAKISDEFRNVFGDAEMPLTSPSPRVRPLYGWQYNNLNNTCSEPLDFMEKAMDNPPNYYFYAGGGAGYYGAANKFGLLDPSLKTGTFEKPAVKEFAKQPKVRGFTFTGDAGIAREGYLNMPVLLQLSKEVENKQAVFLNGTGASVSFSFTAPANQESAYYGVNYRAVLPEGVKVEGRKLSVKVDGEEYAVLTGRGTQPEAWHRMTQWNRKAWWVGSWYFTENIILEAGQTITVTFESMTDECPVFIDFVNMTSLDAFYASEIPSGGAAMGQQAVGNKSHGSTIMGDGRWAATFGLEYMTYEHGWSAGGDAGDTPLQVRAKYYDPRAGDAQFKAIQIFQRAGGINATFGTYATWPIFSEPNRVLGALTIDDWALVQGMNRAANRLPEPVVNGITIPGAAYGKQWSAVPDQYNTKHSNLPTGQWITYNFAAPKPGNYRLAIILEGEGHMDISLHGIKPVIFSGKANGTHFFDVDFNLGVNAVRLTPTSDGVTVKRIACATAGTPDEELLKIRAKYERKTSTKAVVRNQRWINEDFGTKATPLSEFQHAKNLKPWTVQAKEPTGYEIAIENPMTPTSGAYVTGGYKFRSAGVAPDFKKIPNGFHQAVGRNEAFGVPGTAFFSSFNLRVDQGSKAEAGWSRSMSAPDRGQNQVLVTVQGGNWSLSLKDTNNEWVHTDSGIPAVTGQVYHMTLGLSFNEYGGEAVLLIDGTESARATTDAELQPMQFIFYPGGQPGMASLDDLKVGDSLKSVK